jgi:macrolide-specific efflux system membrane fusion protein
MTAQRTSQKDTLVLDKMQNKRNERLFKQGFVSASSVDITQSALDVARSNTHALSDQMKVATATVNTAKANVGYTKITAPMAGEVVSITTLQGQTVNANQAAPIILRIGDMSTVTVWAQVSEADIVHVKPGQDVYFTILGDTRRWKGKIRQIRPTPQIINNVVFYDALFEVPNPDHELEIHMTAKVFISLPQARGVLLIPVAAIGDASAGTKTTVRVLKADGAVEQREITIGIKSEISAEVTDGLKEKELVVIGTVTAQKAVHTGKVQPG